MAYATANFAVALRYWPGFPVLGYGTAALLFWLSGLSSWL